MSESNVNARIRIEDLPVAEELTPEEKELLAGAGLRSFRPNIEALEAREVPAALGPGIDLEAGVLKIAGASMVRTGGDYAFSSHVRTLGADQLEVKRDALVVTVNRAEVTNIVFEGGRAKEIFSNYSGIPSTFQNQGSTDQHIRFRLTSPDVQANPTPDANGRTNPYPDLLNSSANLNARAMDKGQPIGDAIGTNTRPKLNWADLPEGTKSLAVVMRDLDAPNGPFIHWVAYDIPATAQGLDSLGLPGRALEGLNGNDEAGYLGMNPAWGRTTHRYEITLYALRTEPGMLAPQMTDVVNERGEPTGVKGVTHQNLMDAMQRSQNVQGQNAIIAQTSFTATYTLPGNLPDYNFPK
jgi:Raf kinase inhibitor-like YbhB/YbcL family protein